MRARRSTFRGQSCLAILDDGPLLLCELEWRIWTKEWKSGKTKAACAKSADYHRGFKRTLENLAEQGLVELLELNTRISYALAARLAVNTVLGRGQLSAPEPGSLIQLYFDGPFCSVVVSLNGTLSVNVGAVHVGNSGRYQFVRRPGDFRPLVRSNEIPWSAKLSLTMENVELSEEIERNHLPNWRGNIPTNRTEKPEVRTAEGIALMYRHSTPGLVKPIMLTGENFQTKSSHLH